MQFIIHLSSDRSERRVIGVGADEKMSGFCFEISSFASFAPESQEKQNSVLMGATAIISLLIALGQDGGKAQTQAGSWADDKMIYVHCPGSFPVVSVAIDVGAVASCVMNSMGLSVCGFRAAANLCGELHANMCYQFTGDFSLLADRHKSSAYREARA